MNRLIVTIFLIFQAITSVFSQQNYVWIGGKAASMGGTSVALTDFWSVQNNQAGLGFQENFGMGLYSENHYGISSLNRHHLSLVQPVKSGGLGFNFAYSGSKNFNQKKLGIAYGQRFGKSLSMGVQLDYLHTFIGENYGQKGNLTFEAGILAKLTKDVTLGAHVFNPIQVKLNESTNQLIPSVFRLGLSWKISEKLLTAIETESDIENKPIYKAGVEYKLSEKIFARMGVSNNPAIVSFGAGVLLGNFKLDFSSSMHSVLGYSPQFSVSYFPPKTK